IEKYISDNSDLSRTRVQTLCEDGLVLVNQNSVKSSFKVSEGDQIEAEIPADEPINVKPENIPLDVLYEDSDVIVINKPKGMIVHPAPGVYTGTLVNALLYHCRDLSGINGVIRPGIVHRIDKDTTGCIVACKNDFAHEKIAAQLSDKTCHREYKTIVMGTLEHDEGLIDAPIGRDPSDRQKMKVTDKNSREARTRFKVIEHFRDSTYAECILETGRTHQIRAHMKFIGHPVMGDPKYGHICKYMDTQGQVLHAYKLTFVHPRTGESMTFEAPLPKYFDELLDILRKASE
ncbi:MAG: RluA family pseudouridine synthase, partial [Erysipelotrichia bacterium]|nr:RluA family pseudouridine synthase [Erysipelotrichia bacterium]